MVDMRDLQRRYERENDEQDVGGGRCWYNKAKVVVAEMLTDFLNLHLRQNR